MKPAIFLWQWNDHAPQPDTLMTRDRAARLLRAWRSSARRPANYKNVYRIIRIAPGYYRAYSSHGESGAIIILRNR